MRESVRLALSITSVCFLTAGSAAVHASDEDGRRAAERFAVVEEEEKSRMPLVPMITPFPPPRHHAPLKQHDVEEKLTSEEKAS